MRAIEVDASNQVQVNFKEAMTNKVKIDFLEHRANLNQKVFDISSRMAAINAELIQVNKDIMDTNEEVRVFYSNCFRFTCNCETDMKLIMFCRL